ncbi:hypothetical protein ACFL35_15595 [Candidatus Riflebacteria bacterium]
MRKALFLYTITLFLFHFFQGSTIAENSSPSSKAWLEKVAGKDASFGKPMETVDVGNWSILVSRTWWSYSLGNMGQITYSLMLPVTIRNDSNTTQSIPDFTLIDREGKILKRNLQVEAFVKNILPKNKEFQKNETIAGFIAFQVPVRKEYFVKISPINSNRSGLIQLPYFEKPKREIIAVIESRPTRKSKARKIIQTAPPTITRNSLPGSTRVKLRYNLKRGDKAKYNLVINGKTTVSAMKQQQTTALLTKMKISQNVKNVARNGKISVQTKILDGSITVNGKKTKLPAIGRVINMEMLPNGQVIKSEGFDNQQNLLTVF